MLSIQNLLQRVPHWQDLVHVNSYKVLSLIERCHTTALGYHQYRCENSNCNHIHVQYHGCRNRHCPNCGTSRTMQWMEDRNREILPVKYFHVVFTLPHELLPLAYINRKKIFTLLFEASSQCLLTLSHDPKWLGAAPSITSVLHTWGQQLVFHPHIHCMVSGGGADNLGNWITLKKKGKGNFLFPYDVMLPIYRGIVLGKINKMIKNGDLKIPPDFYWQSVKEKLYLKKWIIFAKSPMGGSQQVIEYLGRYTQKIAISNHRIKNIAENGDITFSYKDYANGGKTKQMTLTGAEFLRRFEQHILPPRFVRIRHYGILGNNKRHITINKVLAKMKLPAHRLKVDVPLWLIMLSRFGVDIRVCQKCGEKSMVLEKICFPQVRAGPLQVKNENFMNQHTTMN